MEKTVCCPKYKYFYQRKAPSHLPCLFLSLSQSLSTPILSLYTILFLWNLSRRRPALRFFSPRRQKLTTTASTYSSALLFALQHPQPIIWTEFARVVECMQRKRVPIMRQSITPIQIGNWSSSRTSRADLTFLTSLMSFPMPILIPHLSVWRWGIYYYILWMNTEFNIIYFNIYVYFSGLESFGFFFFLFVFF